MIIGPLVSNTVTLDLKCIVGNLRRMLPKKSPCDHVLMAKYSPEYAYILPKMVCEVEREILKPGMILAMQATLPSYSDWPL